MRWRDRAGVETAAIAAEVDLHGARVLDVGCGTGRLTAFAAAQAAAVTAIDPSAEDVAEARAKVPAPYRDRVRFVVAGAETFRARRHFDVALCGWSL